MCSRHEPTKHHGSIVQNKDCMYSVCTLTKDTSSVADRHSKILDPPPNSWSDFHAVFRKFWTNTRLANPPPPFRVRALSESLDWPLIITARKRSLAQGNIFTPVCHSVHGGACVVAPGGRAWFYSEGVCMALFWGVCMVLFQGVCMVLFGGHAWFYFGGVHGFIPGGHVWFYSGGCVVFSVFSDTMRYGQWAGGTHPTGMHSCAS